MRHVASAVEGLVDVRVEADIGEIASEGRVIEETRPNVRLEGVMEDDHDLGVDGADGIVGMDVVFDWE